MGSPLYPNHYKDRTEASEPGIGSLALPQLVVERAHYREVINVFRTNLSFDLERFSLEPDHFFLEAPWDRAILGHDS